MMIPMMMIITDDDALIPHQVHGPQYVLMMTACGGERRFASTVAKRLQAISRRDLGAISARSRRDLGAISARVSLQALGALTKGDRRAADASDLSDFDVDTKLGKKVWNVAG